MSDKKKNIKNQEKDDQTETEFGKSMATTIPQSIRILVSIFIGILTISIIALYTYLIICNPNYIDPSKFGIPELFLGSITILVLINIPWNKLGIRIKKIGNIELEQVVIAQSEDSSQGLADLQKQINELQRKSEPGKQTEENKLDNAIIEFLSLNETTAFSPLRIKFKGKREGIEEFKSEELTTEQIRESLRRLLSENKVVTRISQKGNTIYKIK